ncbi:MAG TPA: hypothetical protein VNX01_07600 [Bacteroidia bacterium]|nr:hypothetical protein [Bacteroidia bacterium]
MNTNSIEKINNYLFKYPYFEFEIDEFNGQDLHISGGTNLPTKIDIQIIFKNVFHLNLNKEWKSDPKVGLIELASGKEEYDYNKLYYIEQGHNLYKIIPSHTGNVSFYVAAKEVELLINI